MGILVKLGRYYLEWSTVCDAPLTWGMTRAQLKELLVDRGDGDVVVESRLARVDKNGSSCIAGGPWSADDVVLSNRAGPNESNLSKAELVYWYCVRKERPTNV